MGSMWLQVGGGNGGMLANRRFGNRWELFEKIELYPETGLGNPATVILRAESGHFLSADDGGGTSIWAKAQRPGPWERFYWQRIDGEPDKIALRASNNKHYVCAEEGGGRELVVNRVRVGPWEKFTVQEYPTNPYWLLRDGGVYAIQSVESGKWVRRDGGGYRAVSQRAAAEEFTFHRLDGGSDRGQWAIEDQQGSGLSVAPAFLSTGLQAARGLSHRWYIFRFGDDYGFYEEHAKKWMTAEPDGGMFGNRDEFNDWEKFKIERIR